MTTPTPVDFRDLEGSAATAGVRERDSQTDRDPARPARPEADLASQAGQVSPTSGRGGDDRHSIDPLRATDRYRLVTPISLRF